MKLSHRVLPHWIVISTTMAAENMKISVPRFWLENIELHPQTLSKSARCWCKNFRPIFTVAAAPKNGLSPKTRLLCCCCRYTSLLSYCEYFHCCKHCGCLIALTKISELEPSETTHKWSIYFLVIYTHFSWYFFWADLSYLKKSNLSFFCGADLSNSFGADLSDSFGADFTTFIFSFLSY